MALGFVLFTLLETTQELFVHSTFKKIGRIFTIHISTAWCSTTRASYLAEKTL
jgi:hypothetical protein